MQRHSGYAKHVLERPVADSVPSCSCASNTSGIRGIWGVPRPAGLQTPHVLRRADQQHDAGLQRHLHGPHEPNDNLSLPAHAAILPCPAALGTP